MSADKKYKQSKKRSRLTCMQERKEKQNGGRERNRNRRGTSIETIKPILWI